MNAQKKPLLASDQYAPVGGTAKGGREGRLQREDDPANAANTTVQKPIAEIPVRREGDPPDPKPTNTVDPIKRPDPHSKPIEPQKPGPRRGA